MDHAGDKWSATIERSRGTVLYCGRPEWLDAALMRRLLDEVRLQRETAKQINEQRQMGAPAGAVATALAGSQVMLEFVTGHAGAVSFTGDANYLYYEFPGAGIEPHIDRDEFSLQILLMLEQYGYRDRKSMLVVFPSTPRDPLFVPLAPGELILFRAARVIHGRTPVTGNEVTRLLGVGYRSSSSVSQ